MSSTTTQRKSQVFMTVFALSLMMTADAAFAGVGGAGNAIANGLQALIDFLNGGVARSIAIIAVMGFGIGALTGRIDWTRALQVILSIGIIFSAAILVDMFRS